MKTKINLNSNIYNNKKIIKLKCKQIFLINKTWITILQHKKMI